MSRHTILHTIVSPKLYKGAEEYYINSIISKLQQSTSPAQLKKELRLALGGVYKKPIIKDILKLHHTNQMNKHFLQNPQDKELFDEYKDLINEILSYEPPREKDFDKKNVYNTHIKNLKTLLQGNFNPDVINKMIPYIMSNYNMLQPLFPNSYKPIKGKGIAEFNHSAKWLKTSSISVEMLKDLANPKYNRQINTILNDNSLTQFDKKKQIINILMQNLNFKYSKFNNRVSLINLIFYDNAKQKAKNEALL